MGKKQVKAEKGTMLAVATGLIAKGAELIGTGAVANGIVLTVIGLIVIYSREHLKLGRWGKITFNELKKDFEENKVSKEGE